MTDCKKDIKLNPYDILVAEFPNIRTLSDQFYTREPYKSNKYRRCKILILAGSLSNCDAFRLLIPAKQDELIEKIETGCLNYTVKKAKDDNIPCAWDYENFRLIYNNVIYERAEALNVKRNPLFALRVLSGEINPYKIAGMGPEELNQHDKELAAHALVRQNVQIVQKTTNLYTCEQCGKKECTYFESQIRSADEGKSLDITCVYCGANWIIL